MPKVSDLANGSQILLMLEMYNEYCSYINANDSVLSFATDQHLKPASVFQNNLNSAVIIILTERHESDAAEAGMFAGLVADCALAIPNIKVAVEEPVDYNGTLVANVGLSFAVSSMSSGDDLFKLSPTSVASIAHQLYVKQLTGKGMNRYPAEDTPPKPRYGYANSLAVNKDMVSHLIKNTSGPGEVSIFPVGSDHQSNNYQFQTLDVLLKANGWVKLENR